MPCCHVHLRGRKPLSPAYPRELRTLGDHLRKRRLDLGLLQKDVAAQLRADEGSVWNWEANRTAPALRFIPRIVEFLGYVPFPLNGSLPERLKVYRQALGLSQRRLAGVLGVDPGTLARWERGARRPTGMFVTIVETFLAFVTREPAAGPIGSV